MSDIPEGLKPFDLQKALAGDKVVTRDGRAVISVRYARYPLIVVVSGETLYGCTETGRYYENQLSNEKDLFMAPKTKTVWVNIYMKPNGTISLGAPHSSEAMAMRIYKKPSYWQRIKTISVEIPEE